MQVKQKIDAISSRAAAINLSLGHLCRATQVHYSTVLRWQRGEVDPHVGKVDVTLRRLEQTLEACELEILSKLKDRYRAVSSAA